MKKTQKEQSPPRRVSGVKRRFTTELLTLVQKRVGTTPRERLAWAVRAVQRSRKEQTPGDWDNLCTELAEFASEDGMIRSALDWGGAAEKRKEWGQPNREEALAMLTRMGEMIEATVRRQPVRVGTVHGTLFLYRINVRFENRPLAVWVPRWDGVKFDWTERAAHILGGLIRMTGSLLKECPAPLPRDEEACGVWFVARRPKQEYCSATCQTRASTRAARAGTATPAEKRRKTEKEGWPWAS
jgi:hypothetical protein